MNRPQIDQINQDQYIDDLDHREKVYNEVKATLSLCKTMIKALDPSVDDETYSRKMLVSYLELGQSYAMLAGADVQIEKLRVKK